MTIALSSGKRIGFIGFGQMAQSIAHRLIESDMLPGEILFSRRNDTPVSFMGKSITGVTNHEVCQQADIIFLAIKPHRTHEHPWCVVSFQCVKATDQKAFVQSLKELPLGLNVDGFDRWLQS